MNLPISLNETVGADDLTGRNACPIWLRITALMQATPFEAESEMQRESRIKGVEASNHSREHRTKRESRTLWCYLNGILYEFPSLTAFYRKIKNKAGVPYCQVSGRPLDLWRKALQKAVISGASAFERRGYTLFLRNPNPFREAVFFLGD